MRFRPCIDIHNGRVKQIVGGSLRDREDQAVENFVSDRDAAFYARFYRDRGLTGGHMILLNPPSSPLYEQTLAEARSAMRAWPGGLQVGGGIRSDNAARFLDEGASHVIVTSCVFREGAVDWDELKRLEDRVGRDRLVLDLSCRRRGEGYYIVTDRWQKFTDVEVDSRSLQLFAGYCSEFLIHAADVEGMSAGPDEGLLEILAEMEGFPITYAGGVGSYEDVCTVRRIGKAGIDITVGSALDLFGGELSLDKILGLC